MDSLVALLLLSLICTALAYLILFRLLRTTSSIFTSLLNYLIPVFALAWGVTLLGESLRLDAVIALGLILLGVALAQARGKDRLAAPPSET